MNPKRITAGWRIAASIQATTMLVQAVLAGLALSGSPLALSAHMFNGAGTFLIAALQTGFAVMLWRSRQLPRWPLAVSVILLAGQLFQMLSGRFHWLWVHLPLGVGLFGLMSALVYWAWAPQPAPAVGPSFAPRASRALGAIQGHRS